VTKQPDFEATRLREAAAQTRDLSELMDECVTAGLIPLQIGLDFDYIASLFEQAAEANQ
jgi:hypothetical protein